MFICFSSHFNQLLVNFRGQIFLQENVAKRRFSPLQQPCFTEEKSNNSLRCSHHDQPWFAVLPRLAKSKSFTYVVGPIGESKCMSYCRHGLKTNSLETPLLASYIEEGFFRKKEITQLVLREYLSKPTLKNIKALILACTHYPLIKADIDFYYDHTVHLIDSTDVVADFVSALLSKHQLLNVTKNQIHKKDHCFYASDLTPTFEQTAQMFFKNPINLQEKILK